MAITPKTLYGPAQLANSATQLYACPASTRAQISTASFTNTDSGNQTFSVWIVRSGGSATDANLVVDAQGLSATENAVPRQLAGRNLTAGDAIFADASVAAKITCVIDGIEWPV